MQNVYELVTGELSRFIAGAYPAEAGALGGVSLCLNPAGCEVSSAFPLAAGLDARGCALRLSSMLDGCRALGVPLLGRIRANSGGHLCMELEPGFYREVIALAERSMPLPQVPGNVDTAAKYAMCRMLILARGEGSFCGDERVKRAMWACLALQGAGGGAAVQHAAEAVLGLDRLPVWERAAIKARCAGACGLMARLLAQAPA